MKRNVFITGISSGLGRGFALEYLERGDTVYGLSRRGAGFEHEHLHETRADLADLDAIPGVLDHLIGDARIDLAILNAGLLGEFKPMPEIGLGELRRAMDVNVWANKVILDWFAAHHAPRQAVLISSGAAVTGHEGWGSYALSKAALNMLAQLYAHDLPDTHVAAFAPGLIHTAMQDHIYEKVDEKRFPSVKRLKEARNTTAMPEPVEASRLIADAIEKLPERIDSGQFTDIRQF
ncbi:MAG: SDR family NAD(P)-dependent oxidoreductase [Gammaproteobacteria bacterium]